MQESRIEKMRRDIVSDRPIVVASRVDLVLRFHQEANDLLALAGRFASSVERHGQPDELQKATAHFKQAATSRISSLRILTERIEKTLRLSDNRT